MRRQTRHPSLIFLALLASLLTSSIAAANSNPEDTTEYNLQARVARISLLSGDVQLKRSGNAEWESAVSEPAAGRRRSTLDRQKLAPRSSD